MHRKKWLLAVFLASLIGIGACLFGVRTDSLIERAERVGSVDPWHEWLGSDSLVSVSSGSIPVYRTLRLRSSGKLIPDLDSPSSGGVNNLIRSRYFSVSPDLKWALYQSFDKFDHLRLEAFGSPVNSAKQDNEGPLYFGNNPKWAPDGKSFSVLSGSAPSARLRTYSTISPGKVQETSVTAKLPKYSPVRGFRGVELQPQLASSGQAGLFTAQWPAAPPTLMAITPRRTAIVTTWTSGQVYDVDLFEVSLESGGQPIRTQTLEFPMKCRIDEVVVSPQADRVAVRIYRSSPESAIVRCLERIGLYRSAGRSSRDELFVFDLDGTNQRSLGYVATTPHGPNNTVDGPSHLRWLPDGRRISFMYKSGLYVKEVGSEG